MQLLIPVICTILLIIWFWYTFVVAFAHAPYYPSNYQKTKLALKELGLNSKVNFLDVGSGDGRILLLANRLGAGKVTGLEINPFLSLFSKFLLIITGVRNFKVIQGDMYKYNYSEHNFIFVFLLSDSATKVFKQIKETAPGGAVVLTNQFKIKDLKPDRKIGDYYLYIV